MSAGGAGSETVDGLEETALAAALAVREGTNVLCAITDAIGSSEAAALHY